MSVLWITSPRIRNTDATFRCLRQAGLLPVSAPSIETALHLLGQFRASAVVLHAGDTSGSVQLQRVLASGPPVGVFVDSMQPETAQQYLRAGCVAVIAETCPSAELATMLSRIASGHRDIVWPAPSVAAAAHRSATVG